MWIHNSNISKQMCFQQTDDKALIIKGKNQIAFRLII